eukprot:TRINITY_DN2658_c0_g2_i1.p1 TRINITY_DN2658_c0_g2~~TRINITY_DN2658_c0_g2_i1.p1  ORF type:complete len:360 (+),score=75.87 TRINITY_DN2658_c0_g2_i1:449-1528(+)
MPPLRRPCAADPHVRLPRPSWAPPRPHVDVYATHRSGGAGGGALPPGYLPPLTTGLPLSDGLYLPDGAPGAAAGAASAPPCVDARRPHRLRVGYVSSDFMNHPYAHLTRSIYGLHGTGCAVECFCYALTPGDGSQWRATIEAQAEHFRDISGMDTATAAATIAADGIHVLVNANGYTKGARSELFALRPAPVQVSFMGFAGTLAARSIDYALTDSVVTPPSMRAYTYAEALLLHPHSYFVCDHAQSAAMSAEAGRVPPGAAAATPPPVSRARYGLPQNTSFFATLTSCTRSTQRRLAAGRASCVRARAPNCGSCAFLPTPRRAFGRQRLRMRCRPTPSSLRMCATRPSTLRGVRWATSS